MIVCGGCNGLKCLDSVDAYYPKTGKWQKLAPLKTARRGSAIAVIKGLLTFFSITCFSNSAVLSDYFVLDIGTNNCFFLIGC